MFFIFAGSTYYPIGGANDFICSCATLEEAKERIANMTCEWWHITDENLRIVGYGRRD